MRVLVVDAHCIYRQGLVAALSAMPEIDAVVHAPTTDRAAALLPDVDLVVIDIEIAGGVPFVRRLRDSGGTRVLACSRRCDEAHVLAAIEAGALGFLAKDTLTTEALATAVRAAGAGNGVLTPELLGGILQRITTASRTVLEPRGLTLSRLTQREQQVLGLVAAGHATREVAEQLSYSERTVKNVLHDVVTKLNARTRSQAVAFAVREGLI